MTVTDDILDVLETLIAIKSVSDDTNALRQCADRIEACLDDLHVTRFTKDHVPVIYASVQATRQPTVLFNAHFDVVPGRDELFTMRREDNAVFGRGTFDNKGPLAMLIVLMQSLADTDVNVALLSNGDEEVGGASVRSVLQDEGITADLAAVLDGGGLNWYVTKAKGICKLRVTAPGVEAHASRPWLGENAVAKLAHAYTEIEALFDDYDDDQWIPTCTIARFNGGDADNKVPGTASMTLNIRYPDEDEKDALLNDIMTILDDFEVEMTGRPPFQSAHTDLMDTLLRTSEDVVGSRPAQDGAHGASDAIHFAQHGIPSILTRPKGGGSHSDHEYLDTDALETFYTILKRFVREI
jgi:succinyl-diaminopimelate desuccinylase